MTESSFPYKSRFRYLSAIFALHAKTGMPFSKGTDPLAISDMNTALHNIESIIHRLISGKVWSEFQVLSIIQNVWLNIGLDQYH